MSPIAIVEEARRSARYSREEIDARDFSGPWPDIARLSLEWKQKLSQAEELIALLPVETAGTCVLGRGGRVFSGGPAELRDQLEQGGIIFHHDISRRNA